MIRNRYTAAITDKPWWLAGGIPVAACVAAYQPAAAPSLAGSYVNLVSPGLYNAAPGTAPDWDAVNGWKFTGASSHYLVTGITPANTWTAIARMSNITTGDTWAFGSYTANGFGIQPRNALNKTIYYNNTNITINVSRTSGVWAISYTACYYNGVYEGSTNGNASTAEFWIGDISGIYRRNLTGYMQALAIYNTKLSDSQVASLTTAMNAL